MAMKSDANIDGVATKTIEVGSGIASAPGPRCPGIAEPLEADFCPAVFDGYLCWPKTSAGSTVELPCPKGVAGLDENNFVTRQCLADGNWFSCPSKAPNATEVATGFSVATTATPALNPGWTNYTSCYTETTLKLFKDLDYETGCPKGEVAVDSEVKLKLLIAKISRVMEVCGYSISLLVLFFALLAFCYFRKLRKHRVTRIHMNLFASMILQSAIRLIIYIDQFVVRNNDWFSGGSGNSGSGTAAAADDVMMDAEMAGSSNNSGAAVVVGSQSKGIDNTPLLCHTFYTLIEYGKTAMFLWMFIEGIVLHHMTSVAYSRGPEDQTKFYISGWVIPIPLVVLWVVANIYNSSVDDTHCGQGLSMVPTYWILEGPRIFVIVLNIFILLNVARVLFTHLSGFEDADVTQIRKSFKSLLFLLPLLGITNILHHVWPNPLRGSWVFFAVWSITTHFLYSFQGVFVACVYFFCDQKVKKTLYTFWILKVTLRDKTNSNSNCGPQNQCDLRNQNISEAIHGSQIAADEGGKNLVSGNASEGNPAVNKCASGGLMVGQGRQTTSHHFFNHDKGRRSSDCPGNHELVERAPMATAGEPNISRKKSVLRRANKLKKVVE